MIHCRVLCRIRKDSEVTDGDGDDGLQERNQQRLQQEEVERGGFRVWREGEGL